MDVNSPKFQAYLLWAMTTFKEIFTREYWDAFFKEYARKGAYPQSQVGSDLNWFFNNQASKMKTDPRTGKVDDEYFWENISRILRTFAVELENRERAMIE